MAGRIAILLHADHRGGAERATRKVAEVLAGRGQPVDFVLLSGSSSRGLAPAGTRAVELGARRVMTSIRPLAAYLGRERPRAVLSSLTHANLAAVAAARMSGSDARLVLAEHVMLSRSTVASHRRRERVFPALAARLYRRADVVACLSRTLAEDTVRTARVPSERVAVVPLPVSRRELAAAAAGPAPHPWLEEGAPPVVLALGRLERVKAFERLVAALPRVRERVPARLMILGEGRERRRLEAQARALGVADHVTLPGWVDNPYPHLDRAAVVALTSLREGLPTVLIEALALSRPVVAVDCESGPREILADGRYGALVPPGDQTALAEALVAAAAGPAPSVPAEALARYDPEAVADAYLELLLAGRLEPATYAAA